MKCEVCSITKLPKDADSHDFYVYDGALWHHDTQFGWEGNAVKYCPNCGKPLTDAKALSFNELRERDDQLVYAVVNCVFDELLVVPSLVAYDPESEDGDEVYFTNNQGGRSSFEECIEKGIVFYDHPPETSVE